MPTLIPSSERSSFIEIVAVQNPTEAVWLGANLVNYEDIPTAILRQSDGTVSDDFIDYPNYLETAIAVFDDTQLQVVKIFNNKILAGPIVNPLIFINTVITGGTTSSGGAPNTILILSNSSIDSLIVGSGPATSRNAIVGSGSVLAFLDAPAGNGVIPLCKIRCIRDNPGEISLIAQTANVTSLIVDPCAIFGGHGITPIIATCASPVTALVSSNITNVGLQLNWTNTAGWLFNYIYYRENGTDTWIIADDSIGEFIDDVGFIFNQLQADTLYNFRIISRCVNGALSTPVSIDAQTLCCNEGIQNIKTFPIYVFIVANPNPNNKVTLGNGVMIPAEYPSGNIVTIPYLQNKSVVLPVQVQGNNTSATFDTSTAQIDNSSSGGFSIGQVVKNNAKLPL